MKLELLYLGLTFKLLLNFLKFSYTVLYRTRERVSPLQATFLQRDNTTENNTDFHVYL
jgi:hypothetical protein